MAVAVGNGCEEGADHRVLGDLAQIITPSAEKVVVAVVIALGGDISAVYGRIALSDALGF